MPLQQPAHLLKFTCRDRPLYSQSPIIDSSTPRSWDRAMDHGFKPKQAVLQTQEDSSMQADTTHPRIDTAHISILSRDSTPASHLPGYRNRPCPFSSQRTFLSLQVETALFTSNLQSLTAAPHVQHHMGPRYGSWFQTKAICPVNPGR